MHNILNLRGMTTFKIIINNVRPTTFLSIFNAQLILKRGGGLSVPY